MYEHTFHYISEIIPLKLKCELQMCSVSLTDIRDASTKLALAVRHLEELAKFWTCLAGNIASLKNAELRGNISITTNRALLPVVLIAWHNTRFIMLLLVAELYQINRNIAKNSPFIVLVPKKKTQSMLNRFFLNAYRRKSCTCLTSIRNHLSVPGHNVN